MLGWKPMKNKLLMKVHSGVHTTRNLPILFRPIVYSVVICDSMIVLRSTIIMCVSDKNGFMG